MSEKITTDRAPAAVGPYAQGVVAGGLLYTAMQIGLDPQAGKLVGDSATIQVEQCLRNILAIVEAAGGGLESIVKTTVYMRDITQFGLVNEVYAGFFKDVLPARGVLEVSALPLNASIAVEAVAEIGS